MPFFSVFRLQSYTHFLHMLHHNLPSALFIKRHYIAFMGMAILCSFFSTACSNASSTSTTQGTPLATPTVSAVALAHLKWCGNKHDLTFRDDASPAQPNSITPTAQLGPANGTPTNLTDWGVVKANLGFAVFLPPTLPATACLLSAASVIRHPVLGSNLVLTYTLANHETLTISQAPPLHVQNEPFQCSATTGSSQNTNVHPAAKATVATKVDPVLICSGMRATTNIVFSAHGTPASLQKLFMSLQPAVNWLPVS